MRYKGKIVNPYSFGGSHTTTAGGTSITIQNDGVDLTNALRILNFVGSGVEAIAGGASGTINVYVPAPTFDSHWNTNDGANGNQFVSESISRTTARISTPTSEGNPFSTGGTANTNAPATLSSTVTFTTPNTTSGWGGTSNMVVTVYDADGSSVLETYTTPNVTGNGTNTSGTGRIVVTITSYAGDTTRFKAKASVAVDIGAILTANSRQGGRYNVNSTMNADPATDGTGAYPYTQTAVFLDTNPTTPSIGGTVTIGETAGQVITKHLSGIEYYAQNTRFTAAVTDVDQLNRNTARTTQNLRLTGGNYQLGTLNQSPFGTGSGDFTGWNSNFDTDNVGYEKDDWAITSSNVRFRGTDASISAFPRDTWASGGTINSANSAILIDTYGTTSSNLVEDFDDEARRQTSNYNTGSTAGNWTSTNTLSNGEALVMGGEMIKPSSATLTNGSSQADFSLYKPDLGGANPNYTALSATASYFRTIVDTTGTSRSSFTINFTGTFVVDATTDLANQNLKIFIRRRASSNGGNAGYNTAFPLLVHGALYNFATFNDGVTNGQIREASSSGGTVNCTFGGLTCEGGFFIEIQIVNAAIKIDRFSVTFF
jgi:hypothetical protein